MSSSVLNNFLINLSLSQIDRRLGTNSASFQYQVLQTNAQKESLRRLLLVNWCSLSLLSCRHNQSQLCLRVAKNAVFLATRLYAQIAPAVLRVTVEAYDRPKALFTLPHCNPLSSVSTWSRDEARLKLWKVRFRQGLSRLLFGIQLGAMLHLVWCTAHNCCQTLCWKFKLFQLSPQATPTFLKRNLWDMYGVARSDTRKQWR